MNIDPTTTAEHKRREEYDAMMRNLTATQTECTRLLQQKRELDAMLRMAAEDVVSRDTTIRDLRIELAAESAKVGSQATEIDCLRNALNAAPKVGKRRKQLMRALGMPTAHASEHEPNWDDLLQRVVNLGVYKAEFPPTKSETTVQCGAAEWLDSRCFQHGWQVVPRWSFRGPGGWAAHQIHAGAASTAALGDTPAAAREALARSLGWTGHEKAPLSAQEAVGRVEAPPVGSEGLEQASSVPGASSHDPTIAELTERVEAWEQWTPFLKAFAEWRFSTVDCCEVVPPTKGKAWKAFDGAWEGLVNIPALLTRDDEPIPYRVTGPANPLDQCGDCRHKDVGDDNPPCDDCAFSDKPIGWEPADPCPLPDVGSSWKRDCDGLWFVRCGDVELTVKYNIEVERWEWCAGMAVDEWVECERGLRKTRVGAMRAAEAHVDRVRKVMS